jgi:hypothetical protein
MTSWVVFAKGLAARCGVMRRWTDVLRLYGVAVGWLVCYVESAGSYTRRRNPRPKRGLFGRKWKTPILSSSSAAAAGRNGKFLERRNSAALLSSFPQFEF